jgi:uncharacterized protein
VSRARWAFPAALVVVLLLWNDVVIDRVPDAAYVPVDVAAMVGLLAVARATGLSWAELGLSPDRLPAGLLHPATNSLGSLAAAAASRLG